MEILISVHLITFFFVFCFGLADNLPTVANGGRKNMDSSDCDITEIFCDDFTICLAKRSDKDTCESIINELKISCPEKTNFCIEQLICLPENQKCYKKAELRFTGKSKTVGRVDNNSGNILTTKAVPSGEATTTTTTPATITTTIATIATTTLRTTVSPTTIITKAPGKLPSSPDYVYLTFVTLGSNDAPIVLGEHLPENTTSIKVIQINNQQGTGEWFLKSDGTGPSFSVPADTLLVDNTKPITANVVITKKTQTFLQNFQQAGLAQLTLETQSQFQTGQTAMVKLVMPRTATDIMNLTLKMPNFTMNIDESSTWMPVTNLFDLDYSDSFKSFKQDADEIFDKLADKSDMKAQQKTYLHKISQLQTDLGLCIQPIFNQVIVGSVEAENTGNSSKTSVTYKDAAPLCVFLKNYRIKFNFDTGSSGTQWFRAFPWTSDAVADDSSQSKVMFSIDVFSRKLLESNSPAIFSNFTPNLNLPRVPYNISSDGTNPENGVLDVDTIVSQFFALPKQQSAKLGMAVISTGTGNFGKWQYMKQGWTNMASALQRGWEPFKAQVRSEYSGRFGKFFISELKDTATVDVYFIDGTTKIRFLPNSDRAFWSNSEAAKDATLAFLAWNPKLPLGLSNSFSQFDLPLCNKCLENQVSRDGVIFSVERVGCDNILSSGKIYDDCNVCGGDNQCYDCKKVLYGKAKWTCGVCTENGESMKDCRGICNGTATIFGDGRCIDTTKDTQGCDGDYMSVAYINECGYCVAGLTNKSASYGKDQCGLCNGTDACLGCDNKPNSGKVLDLCKRCLSPTDKNFNQGCGVKFGSISNNILSVNNQTVVLEVAGINDNADVVCVLESFDNANKNYTLSASKPQKKGVDSPVFVYAIFYTKVAAGQYQLLCTIDGYTVKFNQTVFIYDYSALQITSVYPAVVNLDDAPSDRKIKVRCTFPAEVAVDPFCFDGTTFAPGNVFRAINFTSTEVFCDMSIVDMSKLISLRVIPRSEMMPMIIEKQSAVDIKVFAKTPKPISANFGTSLSDLTVLFDINVQGPGTCDKIFEAVILDKFGKSPTCSFSANELRVNLGLGCLLNVQETIFVKANVIYQANAKYPSFTPSSLAVSLQKSKQSVIPEVHLDPQYKVPQCFDAITISAKKIVGDGGRSMTYKWNLLNLDTIFPADQAMVKSNLNKFVSAQTSNQVVIPKSLFGKDKTSFTLSVSGCNFLNDCSLPVVAEVVIDALEETLKVELFGLQPPVKASQKLNLYAATSLAICANVEPLETGLKYLWEIVPENNTSDNTALMKYGHTFHIPPYTFKPGQVVQLNIHVTYLKEDMNKNLSATETRHIKFEAEPLWVRLGSSTRRLGIHQQLIIDASNSIDPNRKDNDNQVMEHSWTCLKIDPTQNNSATSCNLNVNGTAMVLEQVIITNQSKLIVAQNFLMPGIYNFTDTVESENVEGSETVTVTYLPNDEVKIEMLPLNERKPNVDKPLNLKWNVVAEPNSTIRVDFIEDQGFGKINVPTLLKPKCNYTVSSAFIKNTVYTFALTLPAKGSSFYQDWQGLQYGTNYKIRVCVNSSKTNGFADFTFRTNEPPSVGSFELISNDTVIQALNTQVLLSAVSGWADATEDLPLTYSFGVRSHFANSKTEDWWFPPIANDQLIIQFPSALTSHPICNRIGYQVMVKVCDYYGACSRKIIPDGPFQVQPPANMTASTDKVLNEIEFAGSTGQVLVAYRSIHLLLCELCDSIPNEIINIGVNVANDLMVNMNESLDRDEVFQGLNHAMDLITRPKILNNEKLFTRFATLLTKISKMFGLSTPPQLNMQMASNRTKRSVDSVSSNNQLDLALASKLMGAYELLLKHSADANTAEDYLKEIEKITCQMCIGRDPTMEPALVSGDTSPIVLVKIVSAEMDANVVSAIFTGPMSQNDIPFVFGFSQALQSKYQSWSCNQKTSTCSSVCLGTAVFKTDSKFFPFTFHFYSNSTEPFSSVLSELYYFQVNDPVTGVSLATDVSESYSIWISSNLSSSGLFQCKVYQNIWYNSSCTFVEAKLNDTQAYVHCSCYRFGYVAVFEAPPPPIPGVSSRDPVNVTFVVNTVSVNKTFLQTLALNVNTSISRFVEYHDAQIDDGRSVIGFVLKPPIMADRQESNFVVLKLNRRLKTVNNQNSFGAAPNSLTVQPIQRNLENDLYPRNITMTFTNDYDAIMQNQSQVDQLISSLTNQFASLLAVKPRRITYMTITSTFGKTVVNFILQPQSSTSKERTAEVAAYYLKDHVYYGDYVLIDTAGISMNIDGSEDFSIVTLDKIYAPPEVDDPVPKIVGSVIGSIFLLVILVVIALVFIKQKGRVEKVSPENSPPHSGNLINNGRSSGRSPESCEKPQQVYDDEVPNAVPNRRYR